MTLVLRPFAPADESIALAGHDALKADDFTFLLGYMVGMPWIEWLESVDRYRAGIDLPPGMVRAAFLAADVDGQLVGRVSIRFELNEWLAREGGHIGYGVLPQFRRRGYATAILRQAIGLARKEGVDALLVVCADNNVGSAKVIESCGGVLQGTASAEDGHTVRRYWI